MNGKSGARAASPRFRYRITGVKDSTKSLMAHYFHSCGAPPLSLATATSGPLGQRLDGETADEWHCCMYPEVVEALGFRWSEPRELMDEDISLSLPQAAQSTVSDPPMVDTSS